MSLINKLRPIAPTNDKERTPHVVPYNAPPVGDDARSLASQPVGDDVRSLARKPVGDDVRSLASQPSAVATPQAVSMDKVLQQRARIELKLAPVFAAHELQLDPLHAEAVRLIHQHQHDPAADTLDRLRECVAGIALRVTVNF